MTDSSLTNTANDAAQTATRVFFHSNKAEEGRAELYAIVQTTPTQRHILHVTNWRDHAGDISDAEALRRFIAECPDFDDARIKDRFPIGRVLTIGDSANVIRYMQENSAGPAPEPIA